jgi:hypothetical protein
MHNWKVVENALDPSSLEPGRTRPSFSEVTCSANPDIAGRGRIVKKVSHGSKKQEKKDDMCVKGD